ncbi:MAG: hypothetical protein JSW67_04360 [Candidatus Latescibacterota bacterium]|nr:MAG: hypothetical protein JSW67_04360 [Candidatus Latescibacterota bacterium]
MSRVIRILSVTLLFMALATTAFAQSANQRVEGMKGVGYFQPVSGTDVPPIVGVRYWMNDGMAVDLGAGIGFRNNQEYTDASSATQTTSFFDFAFDIGLPVVMHGEENMIVYFRPGVTVAGIQAFDQTASASPGDKGYDMGFRGELAVGGEFFLGQLGWPNLSFSGQIGLGVDVMNFGTTEADTDVSFSTSLNDVNITSSGSLGFHIYF